MGAPAASFEVKDGSPTSVAASIARVVQSVREPTALMTFSSGKHAGRLLELARALEVRLPRLPKLLLSGPGVLSERGELEGQDASTGLVWSCAGVSFRSAPPRDLSAEVLRGLLSAPSAGYLPMCLFVRSEQFKPDLLFANQLRLVSPSRVFGAGTHGDPGIVVCDVEGVRPVAAAVVHLRGAGVPRVQTAHSCRLLGPPLPVTRHEGALVFELGGEAALSVLERLGARLSGRPLLFTVLCEDGEDQQDGSSWLVRGIQGIDPARRALLISHELRPNMRMTFAVKDSSAARDDFDRRCRTVIQDLQGAVPRFGLYFNCSGRGRNLHAAAGVDSRILRERFPHLPIAGMFSAFEIAPFGGSPAFQIYTGVLGVFSSPS